MNGKVELLEFLEKARIVTENYTSKGYNSTSKNIWKKIKEEEKEFRISFSPENELEEFWDNFFAKLILLHHMKHSDKEILEAGILCWVKIFSRSLEAKKIEH